jgi:hypothetical protein
MGAILDLIKKYGIRKVLIAISEHLRDSELKKDVVLGKAIREAVKEYDDAD